MGKLNIVSTLNEMREETPTRVELHPYYGLKDGRGWLTRYPLTSTSEGGDKQQNLRPRWWVEEFLAAGGQFDAKGAYGMAPYGGTYGFEAGLSPAFIATLIARAGGRADWACPEISKFIRLAASGYTVEVSPDITWENFQVLVRGLARQYTLSQYGIESAKSVMALGWMPETKFGLLIMRKAVKYPALGYEEKSSAMIDTYHPHAGVGFHSVVIDTIESTLESGWNVPGPNVIPPAIPAIPAEYSAVGRYIYTCWAKFRRKSLLRYVAAEHERQHAYHRPWPAGKAATDFILRGIDSPEYKTYSGEYSGRVVPRFSPSLALKLGRPSLPGTFTEAWRNPRFITSVDYGRASRVWANRYALVEQVVRLHGGDRVVRATRYTPRILRFQGLEVAVVYIGQLAHESIGQTWFVWQPDRCFRADHVWTAGAGLKAALRTYFNTRGIAAAIQ